MRTHTRKVSTPVVLLGLLLTLVFPLFSEGPMLAAAPIASVNSSVLASVAAPTSVTVAGSFQHFFCSGDWQANCAATHMTKRADGVWEFVTPTAIPAGSWAYKGVIDDDWGVGNFGKNAVAGGGDITLNLASATNVTFYYDPISHWITDNVSSKVVVAAGSFQSEIGCPGDWQPSCMKSWMEDIDGDGIYTYTTPEGLINHFEFKATLNLSWTTSYGKDGGGENVTFDITGSKQFAVLEFNGSTNIPTATVKSKVPSQDNNVEYSGLAHDSRNSLYRVPFGAVNPGTAVTLRFRTFAKDVTGVTIRLFDTGTSSETKQPMTRVAQGVDCFDAGLTANGYSCDYWQYSYTPSTLGTVYYRFIIKDGTSTAYYADNSPRYGGVGEATPDEKDIGFRLNVVDPQFKVIPWMQNGVMYQIFPDRFRNGTEKNDPKPTDFRYNYPAPANATAKQLEDAANDQIILKNWNDLPEGVCVKYDKGPANPCAEVPRGRDYFGGDLKGVKQKLKYLESLGITVIYFNPIFESGSNHGYDTRDYLAISRYFGDNEDFKDLVDEAKDRGIRIVLDGVFNHMSSDSPFFDRYHHYSTVGACESAASPYRSWFVFSEVTPGTGQCVDSQNRPNAATYRGWAGFDSIPEIVKKDPNDATKPYKPVADLFYTDPKKSVANYWLKLGAAGWRFDVMTDPSFPVAFWQQLRQITKGVKPDEILIAEAWHWYDNLPLTHGDQADTAMGYRFRNAVFGLLGAVDDKGFDEEGNPNLPPSTFKKRLESMREDYADATYYTFQNILDSHDTKRLLWSLTPGGQNRADKEFNVANVALGKARQGIAAVVQMTVPGTPTIYYGDEVGVTGADDPDDRRTFPWTDLNKGNKADEESDGQKVKYYGAGGDHATLDLYRKLTNIRRDTPVLRNGKLTFLLTDDTNQTVAYALRKGNNLAVIVINRNEGATQTINVPTADYVRDGLSLSDVLSGKGNVTTTGGKFSVSLAPLQAAIFTMTQQDITGPAAPTNLSAQAVNGVSSSVNLSWTAGANNAKYNLYRSPVQGGGYVRIASNLTTTSYTDITVKNGRTYYYVVRGLDGLGNEGSNSNEANATPSFPIGYAVLQYPKTIDSQVITSNYTTIYGQIYVQGLTDQNGSGDPDNILAQVGLGPVGSAPATWNWKPMTYNSGHSGDNNYEYQGQLRAEAVGSYDYLVRFSTDGGRNWVYGDQDGFVPNTNSGTNLPGKWTVVASSDTTAPGAPNIAIDYSATSLSLSWAAANPSDGVVEYRIYRGTTAGGESATPIAIIAGNATGYLDTSVGQGQTYFYKVKAFDSSLNGSPFSNEVSEKVRAKIVQVTFRVKVPAYTPAGDTIYISGSPDPLCNYCGGGTAATAMTETAPGSHIWVITLPIAEGTNIQYKYTRLSYDYVEKWGTITGFTNRAATVFANSPSNLTQLFDETSDTGNDDNHRAVQNWRDALVTSATGGSAAVTVNFNWNVKSDGSATGFSNAIVVKSGNTSVAGTISQNPTNKAQLIFTPSSALAPGSYTVTVDHVVADTDDGTKIRIPYTFTFTV